ncbi:MAG TPA: OB-fold domain-containing protein [Patescibacteria group bacterium]|nr:OB-fold domain-containing protein [Patescibacteria group bacterium]
MERPLLRDYIEKGLPLPSHGKVLTFTTIYDAPVGYEDQTPYDIAIVELQNDNGDPGPFITAQLTDFGDEPVEISTRVEMVTRKIRIDGNSERGLILYGAKFRPILKKA